MAAKKNSLVENINRRKRSGKSRPKSRSTISAGAYEDMQQGWPRQRKKKAAKRKTAKRKKAAKRTAKRRSARAA